jgi:hypothetical protein
MSANESDDCPMGARTSEELDTYDNVSYWLEGFLQVVLRFLSNYNLSNAETSKFEL